MNGDCGSRQALKQVPGKPKVLPGEHFRLEVNRNVVQRASKATPGPGCDICTADFTEWI